MKLFFPAAIAVAVISMTSFAPATDPVYTPASASEAMKHPVILKYYTPEELRGFEQNDTMELKSIIYFFTQSFTVTPIVCGDCTPFDSLNFDIMQYDHLRLQNQVYTRTFDKYGFKLTLVPIDQLPYKYYIHSIPKFDPGDTPH